MFILLLLVLTSVEKNKISKKDITDTKTDQLKKRKMFRCKLIEASLWFALWAIANNQHSRQAPPMLANNRFRITYWSEEGEKILMLIGKKISRNRKNLFMVRNPDVRWMSWFSIWFVFMVFLFFLKKTNTFYVHLFVYNG